MNEDPNLSVEVTTEPVEKVSRAKYGEANRRKFRTYCRGQANKIDATWTREGDDYILTPEEGEPVTIVYTDWLEAQEAKAAAKAAGVTNVEVEGDDGDNQDQ